MSYRLGLLSDIPLIRREGRLWTLDLWASDLAAQVKSISAVTLFSPVVDTPPSDWKMAPVPESVRVVDLAAPSATLREAIAGTDVVQLPGNFTWKRSRWARVFLHTAHRMRKPVILGISSDRATTTLVNASGQNLVRRARARLTSLSVRLSQRYLARQCEGTFVVGAGLTRLVDHDTDNIFVGTASWIRASDIRSAAPARREASTIRLCAAARLEPMKGLALLLDAFATAVADPACAPMTLAIAGQGPEEQSLRTRATALGLDGSVSFAGAFAYPEPFLPFLRRHDIVVLSNLNDEQPRLIFDAISQGCLIVCPDSAPYRALGIPKPLLYARGDAADLARAIVRAVALIPDPGLRASLDALAKEATIESMHDRRREWVQQTVIDAGKRGAGAAMPG